MEGRTEGLLLQPGVVVSSSCRSWSPRTSWKELCVPRATSENDSPPLLVRFFSRPGAVAVDVTALFLTRFRAAPAPRPSEEVGNPRQLPLLRERRPWASLEVGRVFCGLPLHRRPKKTISRSVDTKTPSRGSSFRHSRHLLAPEIQGSTAW